MTGETFGQMLRRIRSRVGISQHELAHRAGCDSAYVNRMERMGLKTIGGLQIATFTPSRHIALGLASGLGLDACETDRLLFTGGLAPTRDYQAIAEDLTWRFDAIRGALTDWVPAPGSVAVPMGIRRRTGA